MVMIAKTYETNFNHTCCAYCFRVYDLSEILFFIQGFVTFERKSRPPVSAVHSDSGLL